MKKLAGFVTAMYLMSGVSSSATTFQNIIELHDFKNGPSLVRKSFDSAWRGNLDFFYQSDTCTGGSSLVEHDGRRDERPINIKQIMLLGEKAQTATSPVYLVSGSRIIWNAGSRFDEISCTWLVSFNGNKVRSIREALDLYYLISGGKNG